jgi:hypothetical protein
MNLFKPDPSFQTYYKCGESINPDVWFEDSEVTKFSTSGLA